VARGRKTGGRLKGSKNKRTLDRERATQQAGRQISAALNGAFEGDAHALLIAVYKDPDQPWQVRIDAAKAALPYEKGRIATAPKQPEQDREPIKISFNLDPPEEPDWIKFRHVQSELAALRAEMATRESPDGDEQS
jgi:hypothetical protein